MELYQKLNSLIESNPNIKELGLIVSTKKFDGEEEKPFLMVENNLAVSFRFIPAIYRYCFETLNKLLISIGDDFRNYDGSSSNSQSQSTTINLSDDTILELNHLSRAILFVNAENITALNVRKKLLCLSNYTTAEQEIKLLNLVFTKHPKSGEAWCHRRWVLNHAPHAFNLELELVVCKRVGEIYPRNYYAWTHRWWALNRPNQLTCQNLIEDLNRVEKWVERNVSDHSAYHHRYLILVQLFKDHVVFGWTLNQVYEIWTNEMRFTDKYIHLYPAHESLWCHKRALYLYWNKEIIITVTTSDDICNIMKRSSQIEYCNQIIQDKDTSYYDDQVRFTNVYLKWINSSSSSDSSSSNFLNK
ncbi:hypothetical protein DFA_03999 [Cavenderia fasciculata]|uniref:Protein prenyltransferase alpha subunit n=1 Tax=Cavenderia fasciculata TaxID=261658 RepID=F4Q104_CACFS|nr:uncharacterized protein DFA_03999 [Cavenderia fasciculata]EGG18505.1 hypothetical protein DFA_03999 [Cavenderia fasciculata]|eukprot:XP_004366409.1 hypothetical protein DFA_03999 [Cavenderia fasciculata]